jgi:hypothetical protein
MWNRPGAKAIDSQATFALTAEQIIARTAFAETLSNQLSANLESLGAFISPGNNEEKHTLMVALSVPMPGLTFTNPDGIKETTRGYTLNINAVIPSPKTPKADKPVVTVPALSYSEFRAKQAAAKATRK